MTPVQSCFLICCPGPEGLAGLLILPEESHVGIANPERHSGEAPMLMGEGHNTKENGNYYNILGLHKDNGKEHGNY